MTDAAFQPNIEMAHALYKAMDPASFPQGRAIDALDAAWPYILKELRRQLDRRGWAMAAPEHHMNLADWLCGPEGD